MERVDLLKVGGICAVLYSGVVVLALVLFGATGLLDAWDATAVLPILAERRTLVIIAGWLFVVAPIALAVAGLGFFMAFRSAGSLVQLALLTFLAGSLLALLRNVVWLAMTYELAPAYAAAAEPARSTLAAVGDTLISFGFIAGDVSGGVLVAGIGLPLFSAAGLHTKVASNWVGWLGFPVALAAGWLTPLASVSDLFAAVNLIGFVGFLVWMVTVGITVWRLEDANIPKRHLVKNE